MTHKNRTYVLMTREVLVAQDMAQTISDLFPAAQVLKFHETGPLQAALPGLGAVDMAFIDAGAMGEGRDRILAAMAATGARIVLLGVDDRPADTAEPTWRSLPIPFDTAMLRERLT